MNEFEQLVWDMRNAQITYFRTRSVKYLQLSKLLEQKVDEYLNNKMN